MQIAGESIRVKLKVNLERYEKGLIEGAMGWTIPNVKLSDWGYQDRFVAVMFDNGAKLDILWGNLEQINTEKRKNINKL